MKVYSVIKLKGGKVLVGMSGRTLPIDTPDGLVRFTSDEGYRELGKYYRRAGTNEVIGLLLYNPNTSKGYLVLGNLVIREAKLKLSCTSIGGADIAYSGTSYQDVAVTVNDTTYHLSYRYKIADVKVETILLNEDCEVTY